MSAASKPQGQAMYVASSADGLWLLNEQRKLYAKSWNHPEYVFRKLWGLVTDRRNLRMAFARVSRNRGRRSPGVDGVTVRKLLLSVGVDEFVDEVRVELRSGTYVPSPVRRVLIPKTGQPGKFRALGIPTVKDRVVQAAVTGGRMLRWQDGGTRPVALAAVRVRPYRLAWQRPPSFVVNIYGEPGAQRKVHAGFGERRPETPRSNAR